MPKVKKIPQRQCVGCRTMKDKKALVRIVKTPEGEICKLGQALSMKQALSKLVDKIASDPNHVGRTLVICHCNCKERAEKVKEQILAKCQVGEILVVGAGGITTVYANDGGVVVAY